MPEPEKRDKDQAANPTADETNIPDEDAFDDAETAREAREEAEKLNAVPYERHNKEEEGMAREEAESPRVAPYNRHAEAEQGTASD